MRSLAFISLLLLLVSFGEAAAQPARTLLDAGAAGRVEARPRQAGGETLRLTHQGRSRWQARAQRFEPFRDGAPVPAGEGVELLGITGWTGGAYCCWTLHLFHRSGGTLSHVASLPLGKREPDDIRLGAIGGPPIQLADAAFDFWEAPISRATDLHPTVPLRWTGRALVPDVVAMRRPVSAALGTACIDMATPDHRPPPEQRVRTYPALDAAIVALRSADWSSREGTHPGVEAARLATCLIYAGHAGDAQRLLRAAWPEGVPGLAETERQIAARLACSPFVAAVREANVQRAPFLGARCVPNGRDQTAVFALDWR